MAGINFNGNNYNNNLNGLNAKTNFNNNNIFNSTSGQKNDELKFKNQLNGDSFEFSGSKSTEGNNRFNVKSKSSNSSKSSTNSKSSPKYSDYIKRHWDLVGGAENYNGKGGDEMGFSVFVMGTLHWAYDSVKKLFK